MRRNRLSGWLAAAGILLSLTLVFAGARAQSASLQVPASGSTASKLAEEQFKNIQALKGIPADQVVPSMQFIAALSANTATFAGHSKRTTRKPKSRRAK
ncbi:MAG TPA: hypothetical protein VIW93_02205 [Candidatus Acidoferrum sp.]